MTIYYQNNPHDTLLYNANWALTWARTAVTYSVHYKNTGNLGDKQDVLVCITNFQNNLRGIIQTILNEKN